MKQKVWFTADLHIQHKNVLKHCPERAAAGGFDCNDIEAHDKWVIDTWNKTVSKNDIVYILGDFSFAPSEVIKKKILPKLNGTKFLILGNHDKSSSRLDNYFQQITQIKEVTFKQKNYDFLKENFSVVMCHFPMLTWNRKMYGVCHLHGHCHNTLSEYNVESGDLRVDVGFDSDIANFNLVDLETVYQYMRNIVESHGFNSLQEYSSNVDKYVH